jgi:predicted P-loop ATPase
MPVLIGDQGEHKSTGLRILIGNDWFADRVPPITNKDALIQLHGKLLIEWPEIETLGNAHKAFISTSVDRFRAPYGRIAEDHARTCSFCGTTNFGNFVSDASGARRFWPVYVTTAGDRNWLTANRDLIWRLACEAEADGEVAWLHTKELQEMVRLRQDDAQQPDPWTEPIVEKAEERVRAFGGDPRFPGVTINAAFLHGVFGGLTSENQNPKDLERATRCLMRAHWRRGTGRAYKRWFPPGHKVEAD